MPSGEATSTCRTTRRSCGVSAEITVKPAIVGASAGPGWATDRCTAPAGGEATVSNSTPEPSSTAKPGDTLTAATGLRSVTAITRVDGHERRTSTSATDGSAFTREATAPVSTLASG